MTEKQIESAENHYNDFPTYPLQPCFGTEYEAGTLFCDNCRDKKECWVKMETGSIPVAIKPNMPSICEYEKRWETRALALNCTDPYKYTLYVNYTCGCVYCAYPDLWRTIRDRISGTPHKVYSIVLSRICAMLSGS